MHKRAITEVEGWFARAKTGQASAINLWFRPNVLAFRKLAKQQYISGVVTNIYEYCDGLYEIVSGSGDCEERLIYLGKVKG